MLYLNILPIPEWKVIKALKKQGGYVEHNSELDRGELNTLLLLVQVEQETLAIYKMREKGLQITKDKYMEKLKSIERKIIEQGKLGDFEKMSESKKLKLELEKETEKRLELEKDKTNLEDALEDYKENE